MENTGERLAGKLRSEGARTSEFFKGIHGDAWQQVVFSSTENPIWSIRDVFEHLVISEDLLRALFRDVAAGREGAPRGFKVDDANNAALGTLRVLSLAEVFSRFQTGRDLTAAFAEILTSDQLATIGRHPFLGLCTLEEMLRLISVHNAMHVKDIKKSLSQQEK